MDDHDRDGRRISIEVLAPGWRPHAYWIPASQLKAGPYRKGGKQVGILTLYFYSPNRNVWKPSDVTPQEWQTWLVGWLTWMGYALVRLVSLSCSPALWALCRSAFDDGLEGVPCFRCSESRSLC